MKASACSRDSTVSKKWLPVGCLPSSDCVAPDRVKMLELELRYARWATWKSQQRVLSGQHELKIKLLIKKKNPSKQKNANRTDQLFRTNGGSVWIVNACHSPQKYGHDWKCFLEFEFEQNLTKSQLKADDVV